MPDRFRAWLRKEITAPRWVAIAWFFRDAFLILGAGVVIVLWWQAATRDEEADRNARIQSCASVYAATYSAWDADAQRQFGELVAASTEDADPDPALVQGYADSTANTAELAKLRIGLGVYSAASVKIGNDFECPPLPDRLMVEPTYPEGFDP